MENPYRFAGLSQNKTLVLIGLVLLIVLFLPYIITRLGFINFGLEKPNEIGDTIGGILGPALNFISSIAVMYTILLQNTDGRTRKRILKKQYLKI